MPRIKYGRTQLIKLFYCEIEPELMNALLASLNSKDKTELATEVASVFEYGQEECGFLFASNTAKDIFAKAIEKVSSSMEEIPIEESGEAPVNGDEAGITEAFMMGQGIIGL